MKVDDLFFCVVSAMMVPEVGTGIGEYELLRGTAWKLRI